MKNIALAALLLLPLLIKAQQKKVLSKGDSIYISKTLTAQPGEVYLDSVKIDLPHLYLDPENILETKVYKGESAMAHSGTEGATLITRKVQGDIISLNDYTASLKAGSGKLKKAKTMKLYINNEVINDPENYKIEVSSVLKVSILNYHDKDATHEDTTASVVIIIKGYSAKNH